MRILHINVNCKRGSTGKITYDLYTTLRANGYDAAICYGRGPLLDEPNIYRFSSILEPYFHALLTRIIGLTGCFSPIATHRLIRFMDEYKPDVVHVHELYAYFVNIASVINYLKKHNIKTIWTFHCELAYTGKCGYTYGCERWRQGCGKCPDIKRYITSWFIDCTAKMFRQKKRLFEGFDNLIIVPVSEWLAARVKQSPILNDKRLKVVHNGIDLNIFYPRDSQKLRIKHGLTDEKIIVHVTPNFDDERKGGRFVLDLARRLKNQNVKIVIIGIAKPIDNCPVNVIAIGRTENQHQLAEYYSLGDIFLLTSEKETFSMPCAESLCCGVPIIGFDAGAPSEVAPPPYGVFVPYGDMDELERVVNGALLGNVHLAESERCVVYGREHYCRSIMLENYLKLYEEMLENNLR